MEQGYYIKKDGTKIIIPPANDCKEFYYSRNYDGFIIYYFSSSGIHIEITCKDVVEIDLPSGYYSLTSVDGILKKLIVADDISEIYCYNNKIEVLIIPSSIKHLWAYNNPIKKISLPHEINTTIKAHVTLDIETPINPLNYEHINFKFY